jgi:cation transport regulator ChaC
MSKETYVFGYGSLVDQAEKPGAGRANLRGYSRAWNVAMDNSVNIPGYYYLVDPATRRRPSVFVTFLNIVMAKSTDINGLLIPVSPDDLAVIDRREQNYDRVEVTGQVEPLSPDSRAYTYIGKKEAEDRFAAGAEQGTALINQAYWDKVIEGFGSLGEGQLELFEATTEPHHLPMSLLEVVRLANPRS